MVDWAFQKVIGDHLNVFPSLAVQKLPLFPYFQTFTSVSWFTKVYPAISTAGARRRVMLEAEVSPRVVGRQAKHGRTDVTDVAKISPLLPQKGIDWSVN